MAPFDPYDVLGVTPAASRADIKRAYRGLAKRLHPDKQGTRGSTEPQHDDAAAQFRRLTRAYEVLSDPQKRAHHDWLRRQKTPGSATSPNGNGPAAHGAAERASAQPARRHDGHARGEGHRRRRYRHEVADETRERGRQTVAEHATWLDDLAVAPPKSASAHAKSHLTLWLALSLLVLVIALLVSAQ